MLSNQCLITLPEVRTKGLVPIVHHTRLRLSVNKVEGHIGLTIIRALQAARLIDQEPTFWLMQGLISADSFSCYRLELAVNLTEEEGDRMVHQLAGLGDRAELPPGSEYWERDGDLCPEYDEVVE